MTRAVRFHRFGGPEVLQLDTVETPAPGPSQVRISVMGAGLNPADAKVRSGLFRPRLPVSLPSGIGFEAAGRIDALGSAVTGFAVGDEVFGLVHLGGIAEQAIADAAAVARRPPTLPWVQAAALASVGQTALDVVASQPITETDTVLVSAAAGGVGVIVAQLAALQGARVVGTAGPQNAEFLRSLGVLPIAYGPGLAERLLETVDDVTVVLDQAGEETVEAALALGVPPERINTIVADAARYGVRGVGQGRADAAGLEVLAEQVAEGVIVLPIDSVHSIDDVAAAMRRLESRHARGKVVVAVDPAMANAATTHAPPTP